MIYAHRNYQGSGGFTLVELLVAMALSLFLMGGAILMYLSVQSTYDDTNRLSRLQENIRFASDYVVRDVRNAGFRDELSLTVGEEEAIRNAFVTVSGSGTELSVRYAGRGHCGQEFDEYRVVQNTYLTDGDALWCVGTEIDIAGNESDAVRIELVAGVTGLNFQMLMADGTTVTNTDVSCTDNPLAALANRCLAVRMGMEFEALRDPNVPGTIDRRYVELFAAFRNSAIGHIYGNLYDDDSA